MGLPDARTPLLRGVAIVNATHFDTEAALCMVVVYDHSVRVSTQGHMNPKKGDRMLAPAEGSRMPLMLYAEGGGGRPADTDRLDMTCSSRCVQLARLSGLVADRRIRRHGVGGLRTAWLPQGDGGDRRFRARGLSPQESRGILCQRDGRINWLGIRDRQRNRSRGAGAGDQSGSALGPSAPPRTSRKCRCIYVW